MNALASLLERRPLLVAALAGALTLVAAVGATRLRFDDVPRGIFRADDAAYARLEALYDDFGSDDNDCFVVLEADDWFAPERGGLLRDLARRLEAEEGVQHVVGLHRLVVAGEGPLPQPLLPGPSAPHDAWERARETAAAHPLVRGRLLSEDGRTALLVARLAEEATAVQAFAPVVKRLGRLVADATAGTDVRGRLTGIPPLRAEIFDLVKRENVLFFAAAAVLGLGVALILFRRVGPVVAVATAAFLGAFWGVGAMGHLGMPMDILKTILPSVVMAIGLTDAIHLAIDVRRGRAAGARPLAASAASIRHLGLACMLTSVTTAVGFASLAVGRVPFIRSFGTAAAVSVALTFLAVLTTAPFAASRVRDMGQTPARWQRRLSRWADRTIDAVLRRAWPIAVGGLLLTVTLLFVTLQLEPDNRLTESTPRSRPSVRALEHLDRAFGGSMFAGVVVEWPEGRAVTSPGVLQALGEVEQALDAAPHFAGATSVSRLLDTLPGGADRPAAWLEALPDSLLRRYVRPDRRRALVSARLPDLASAEAERATVALERALEEVGARHPDLSFWVTGTTIVARRNVDEMIEDFMLGLGIAAVVIFAVIALALRSVRLGLLSLVPNAFPLVVGGAVLQATGHTLQMASAVSFTILLGIAVDDTVHVLVRLRRELAEDGDLHAALRRTVHRVGTALLVTTCVLTAGFAPTLFSAVPTTRVVGTVCCLGFAAALLGDLVLLPALLVCARPGRRPALRHPA